MALRWLAIAGLALSSHRCELPPRPTPEPDPPIDALAEAEANWQQLGLVDYEVTVTQTTLGTRRVRCTWVSEVRGTNIDSHWSSWGNDDCGDWDISVPGLHQYISDRRDDIAVHGGTLEIDWAESGVPNTVEFDLDDSEGEERSLRIHVQDLTGIDTARTMSAALPEAQARWADAGITSYQLVVAQNTNFWSRGCVWTTTVTDGEVTATSFEATTPSPNCREWELTVERLHAQISRMLDQIDEFSPPLFGSHTLDVAFNDVGVPTQLTYDISNLADEESSLVVTFSPLP